ncbi:MAG: hypothetical protein PVI27_12700, partial [Desulfobacteraceae bacterium]
YFDLLARLPLGRRLDAATTARARKYAYHFFFRRMIPLAFFEPKKNSRHFKNAINDLEDLLPEKCAGLDVICDGILRGTDFIYPAEFNIES